MACLVDDPGLDILLPACTEGYNRRSNATKHGAPALERISFRAHWLARVGSYDLFGLFLRTGGNFRGKRFFPNALEANWSFYLLRKPWVKVPLTQSRVEQQQYIAHASLLRLTRRSATFRL